MGTLFALSLWILVLGWAARPSVAGHPSTPILSAFTWCAVAAPLAASPFWLARLNEWQTAEAVTLAGPETAYLCLWALVLRPLLVQRFDGAQLVASVSQALVAAAAVGLAVDIGDLVFPYWSPSGSPGWVEMAAFALLIGILFVGGLALAQQIDATGGSWDYPAWFAGFLVISHPAASWSSALALNQGDGLWVLSAFYALAAAIHVWQGSAPFGHPPRQGSA
ncbi:hypothetical protein ABC977_07650 [Thioalkalicoccus limnaeus]|uniref:Uncharacterized protein n=1 Tax=Thioalkalicoccus limnaeus TaxID=120681 RepID=A0ABV4BCQ2_9GAMM